MTGTNQKLLDLLSTNIESQRSLEQQILGRLGPGHTPGRSTPVNRPPSRSSQPSAPRGAEAGPPADESRHDKSFDSEMADEGLDLSHVSQNKEASMFVGPYLTHTEEDLIHGMCLSATVTQLHPSLVAE